MTVSELMDILADADPDAEVRIAEQPRWAFEYELRDAQIVSYPEEETIDSEDGDDFTLDKNHKSGQQIVYLEEGTQLCYLHTLAHEALQW